MSSADEELDQLKAVERAAHARLERLNRTDAALHEVRAAEALWKEALGSLRDY